ncbi:MAG: PA0069 family radical SAM protein [Vampirovibrionales bacterium]|nr:PA0069 family radical SAM protein [Vampirovibrionales bacterium]
MMLEQAKKPEQGSQRGRGALINPTGRFEKIELSRYQEEMTPEWLEALENTDRKTQYFKDHTQSIVTFNDSPDVGFDASINPYRGCEHGCIYCYARPTHEYLGLSAGLDFESKIFVKTDAAGLLRKKLASTSWEPIPIAMSGVTDPYQPAERLFKITRQCLEVLLEFRNPVGMITKNHLITRDIDLLCQLAELNLVRVLISVTSLNETITNVMEPRTARPAMRLRAIGELSQAGIPVGVMMGPIVPGLTDHEIDKILQSAAEAGARFATHTILRLPYGVKEIFPNWLEAHFPDRKNKVLNRLKDMRNGELNDNRFGHRMGGGGPFGDLIRLRFKKAKERYGLNQPQAPLSLDWFKKKHPEQQLKLF